MKIIKVKCNKCNSEIDLNEDFEDDTIKCRIEGNFTYFSKIQVLTSAVEESINILRKNFKKESSVQEIYVDDFTVFLQT